MEFQIAATEEYEKGPEPHDRLARSGPGLVREPVSKPGLGFSKWETHASDFIPVIYRETKSEQLSLQRHSLLKAIFDEDKLLGFKGDPEDKNFVPLSRETLERAKVLLSPYWAFHLIAGYSLKVLPGPDGSLDIHWKNKKKELLLNIPSDNNSPAQFYGDDYGKLCIEGKMESVSLPLFIINWLINC
jgi:hypothetical protein